MTEGSLGSNLPEAVYLGDGLYASFDGWQIELYSFDGIRKLNSVFLEPSVLVSFENYVRGLRSGEGPGQ